jgi:type IV secretion system protein VirD4
MSDVIVGRYKGRYLMARGQQFVLVAAPTGANKGTAVALPNLLNFPDSIVTFDLKLENFKLTSKYRQQHGQEVFLWAPFSEERVSHRINLLDTISRDSAFRVGDILAIGQSYYPSDCDPREKFWNDNARNLFLGFVLYLMETPGMPCTMGEIFRQSSGKGRPLKTHIEEIIAERAASDNPLSDDCVNAFNRFLASPENTLGNIISSFNAPLLVFANPIVDAATCCSDFDIAALRSRRITLYVGVQPSRLADAAVLINTLFSRIIELNTKELPENNPALKYQCLLLLDEFTAMGKIGIIAKSNSYIRGYNLRLLTIIQSVAQLESVYGAADTRTLVTNHNMQILYPPREQKDANEYSEMLGYFTEKAVSTGISRPRAWGQGSTASENTSDQRRALMLPQELKELPQNRQIIILENSKPVMCEKARYYEDHRFIDRLKSVSPSLSGLDRCWPNALLGLFRLGPMVRVNPTERQIKHAAFVLEEMSIAVPQLDLELHRAKVEQRIRPLVPGESVDVSRLAIDVQNLPKFDDQESPSPEQAARLVDEFFSQLDWIEEAGTGDASEGTTIEDAQSADATTKATGKKRARKAVENPRGTGKHRAKVTPSPGIQGTLDLTMLDK